MKEVILSADGDSIVYLVPDAVADNLEDYCLEFCSNWLRNSPDAENPANHMYNVTLNLKNSTNSSLLQLRVWDEDAPLNPLTMASSSSFNCEP